MSQREMCGDPWGRRWSERVGPFFQCQQPLLNQSVDSNKLLLPPCVVESQLREPVITVSNSSNTTLCQYLEKTGKEKPSCFVEAVAPCELRC